MDVAEEVTLVFKDLPVIMSDSKKINCISYKDYLKNSRKFTEHKLWVLKKNLDSYDGTWVSINLINRTPLLSELLFHLEANGFKLGCYSEGREERKFEILEAQVDNKDPEYCEIYLEKSRAEEVAREIVDFLSRWGKPIAISIPKK
jgi:hypothetical protein